MSNFKNINKNSEAPLAVDLDGTLIKTDLLYESALAFLAMNILNIFYLVIWVFKGKAYLKRKLALNIKINPANLPYRLDFLEWLNQQKKSRTLILISASDQKIVDAISEHLGIFDCAIGSDGIVNMAGIQKRNYLVNLYGENNYSYAANNYVDLDVWKDSKSAILTSNNERLLKRLTLVSQIEKTFKNDKFSLLSFFKTIRIHQWTKNFLIFVPIFAAHNFINIQIWTNTILAFFVFGLLASSLYIFNDLLDIQNDRLNADKSLGPIASGNLPIPLAFFLMSFLLLLGVSTAFLLIKNFYFVIGAYFLISFLYSSYLKKLVIIDCITLALLYTLRVVAGIAVNPPFQYSFWLLCFSFFFFLSLAFLKRYAEISNIENKNSFLIRRGYIADDKSLIMHFGINAGFISVVIFTLYLNSDLVNSIYPNSKFLWGSTLPLFFWILWVWLKASRNGMTYDPIVFAFKDKTSLICGFFFLVFLVFAS
jgi:4-hydroxybenzoate polyprenyltransferase